MRKIKVKTAGIIFLSMMALTIIVHLLVIIKILPYEWVNGGRTLSYNDAFNTAFVSIIILLIISLFIFISSTIVQVKLSKVLKIIMKIISWILVLYFGFSFVLQFLGTKFEIFFMSIVCFISLLSAVRIAIEKEPG
jgi:hypothetical protein